MKQEKKDLLDCIVSLDTDITKYSSDAEKKEKSVAALHAALEKLEKDLIALE